MSPSRAAVSTDTRPAPTSVSRTRVPMVARARSPRSATRLVEGASASAAGATPRAGS